jgi:F0F1-type ATP synthase epsilon subunit
MAQKLQVKIQSSEKIIWQGECDSLSSINSAGPFDILPFHSNFITFIENQPIIARMGYKKEEFNFNRSIIFVSSNTISIYTNI